jgi:hypothetical protein
MPLNWRKLARKKLAGGFRRPLLLYGRARKAKWGVLLGAVEKTIGICLLSVLKAPVFPP